MASSTMRRTSCSVRGAGISGGLAQRLDKPESRLGGTHEVELRHRHREESVRCVRPFLKCPPRVEKDGERAESFRVVELNRGHRYRG